MPGVATVPIASQTKKQKKQKTKKKLLICIQEVPKQ
jgi:hypothetical protein